jgi:hypothetical protein
MNIKRRSSGITSLTNQRARLHLRSNSKLYAEDSAYALIDRSRTKNLTPISLNYSNRAHTFPSLGKGVWLRTHGEEFTDEEFDTEMTRLTKSRSRYKRLTYDRRDGATRVRWQKHDDPVIQLPINFRPDHAAAFSVLDNMNAQVKRPVSEFGLLLTKCMSNISPYEMQAVVIHPESGNLHFHIVFSLIDAEGTLLHARGHAGRHGMKTAGMGLIGALRLDDVGLISEEYSAELKRRLESRYSETEKPYDYLLSEYLDSLVELWVSQNRQRKVGIRTIGEIFDSERLTWITAAKKRLDTKLGRTGDRALLEKLLEAVETQSDAKGYHDLKSPRPVGDPPRKAVDLASVAREVRTALSNQSEIDEPRV